MEPLGEDFFVSLIKVAGFLVRVYLLSRRWVVSVAFYRGKVQFFVAFWLVATDIHGRDMVEWCGS